MKAQLYDVAIVGGGLCGLACALKFQEQGLNVCVLEAHHHPGGRIRSVRDSDDQMWLSDLGPTWVWPDYQPVLKRWAQDLDVEMFPQYEKGLSIVELNTDAPPQQQQLPVQQGSFRVLGGTARLIDQLLGRLSSTEVNCSKEVSSINIQEDHIEINVADNVDPVRARRVVVAIPPRLAAQLCWSPNLPETLQAVLRQTPTWMAPHAKVVLLYEDAFWRQRNLAGRVMSRVGPIVELQDHCGVDGYPAALVGFLGLPHASRVSAGDQLAAMIAKQLMRLFGEESPAPLHVVIKDWADDRFIAAKEDRDGPGDHPSVQPELVREGYYNQRLWFATAETASVSPGLIEGAFSAADTVSLQVIESL